MRNDVMALLVAAVCSEAFRAMKSPFGLSSPGCFQSLCLEQSAPDEGLTMEATKQVSFISSSV